MRYVIFGIAAVMYLALPAVPASASGLDAWKAECRANGATDIRQVAGQWKCDPPGGSAPRASAPVHTDPAYLAFKADCDAHAGIMYTADQWNVTQWAKQIGQIQPDQLKCHRPASWTVD